MLKEAREELERDFYDLLKSETHGMTIEKVEVILAFLKKTELNSTRLKYHKMQEKLRLLEKHFGTEIEEQDHISVKRDALVHLESEIKEKLRKSEQKERETAYKTKKSYKLTKILNNLKSDIENTTYPTFGKPKLLEPSRRRPRSPSPDVRDWSSQNSDELKCLVCGIAGVGLSREHTSPHRVFCGTDCQKEFYFKE
jgi:hypothetical protein